MSNVSQGVNRDGTIRLSANQNSFGGTSVRLVQSAWQRRPWKIKTARLPYESSVRSSQSSIVHPAADHRPPSWRARRIRSMIDSSAAPEGAVVGAAADVAGAAGVTPGAGVETGTPGCGCCCDEPSRPPRPKSPFRPSPRPPLRPSPKDCCCCPPPGGTAAATG